MSQRVKVPSKLTKPDYMKLGFYEGPPQAKKQTSYSLATSSTTSFMPPITTDR